MGLKAGVPIGLGYFSVAFAFGIMAISFGLTWWEALLISMTNLTSAGQFAGLNIMVAGGGFLEMAVTQLTINLRYSLMSISLSQKADEGLKGIHRWLVGFGITDEIFAVACGKEGKIGRLYMAGLIIISYIGWASGTFLGAICGNILPDMICNALNVALYGMFIAIVVSDMKQDSKVFAVVIVAVVLSCCFTWIPFINKISTGFAVTLCTIIAAFFGAYFFPVEMEDT